jgi:hypothetical protein
VQGVKVDADHAMMFAFDGNVIATSGNSSTVELTPKGPQTGILQAIRRFFCGRAQFGTSAVSELTITLVNPSESDTVPVNYVS